MGLLRETITTFWNNYKASLRYKNTITPKLNKNESYHISSAIDLDGKFYRVARLGPYKIDIKTKQTIDFKGYLVLDESKNIVTNKELVKKILPIYEIWYYNYVNTTFPSLLSNFPSIIKYQIETINKLKESIESRRSRGYEKETKKFDKEYAELLEQLDEQVIKHNQYYIKELEYVKKFVETEKESFKKLSSENHNKLLSLASAIRMELLQENVVWLERKEIWHKFIDKVKLLKKETNSEFDTELIESLAIDTITIPLPIPYAGTGYLLLKRKYNKASKKIKDWYYEDILKQKLGMEAIEQHVKDNVKVMEKLNILNRIIETIDYSKVRY